MIELGFPSAIRWRTGPHYPALQPGCAGPGDYRRRRLRGPRGAARVERSPGRHLLLSESDPFAGGRGLRPSSRRRRGRRDPAHRPALGADPALEAALEACPLDLVRLVAPTTHPERVREITRASQGSSTTSPARRDGSAARVARRAGPRSRGGAEPYHPVPSRWVSGSRPPRTPVRSARPRTPAVVGSALVDRLDEGGVAGALELARELRAALDGVRWGVG